MLFPGWLFVILVYIRIKEWSIGKSRTIPLGTESTEAVTSSKSCISVSNKFLQQKQTFFLENKFEMCHWIRYLNFNFRFINNILLYIFVFVFILDIAGSDHLIIKCPSAIKQFNSHIKTGKNHYHRVGTVSNYNYNQSQNG